MDRMKWDSKAIKRKVKCFDTINKKLLFESDSVSDAAKLAGVDVGMVFQCIKQKSKSHKNKFNIPITFR